MDPGAPSHIQTAATGHAPSRAGDTDGEQRPHAEELVISFFFLAVW